MFCLSRVTAKTHKLAVRKFKSIKKEKKKKRGTGCFNKAWREL